MREGNTKKIFLTFKWHLTYTSSVTCGRYWCYWCFNHLYLEIKLQS